ncbi:MAG: 6-phosphogluconolactonase [Caldilineae bacterium]|nr:MAG: 6-phosphogluconolactonase [Caldilineae bacterium]
MDAPTIEVLDSADLAERAAGFLQTISTRAVATRGVAHVALSGGSTPRALYRLLATPAWRDRIPWAHVHLWWVDERCVPPDDPESNYGVAFTLLLQHLPVTIVHRMHGEAEDPGEAARRYEQELRRQFGLQGRARPRMDLIFLGMGADGHTASLFPGTASLQEKRALVTVGRAPNPPHLRLTLTLPVLNRAANVLFMVAGANKGPALRKVLHPRPGTAPLPAAMVRPGRGRLTWLLDRAAAEAAGIPVSA